MVVESIDWMFADGERLATCSHNHPFAVLGPQPLADGNWVVRAWLPDANQVWLLHQGQELAMECPHHPWLFEQVLPQEPGSGYRLRVHRAGITHEQHDPFAFREDGWGKWIATFSLRVTTTTFGAGWVPTPPNNRGWQGCNFVCGRPVPAVLP